MISMLYTNFRTALRTLSRHKVVTLTSVGSLAIGIGFGTSAFSLMNALFLRSMPYPQGELLMRIFRVSSTSDTLPHGSGIFLDVQNHSTSFSQVSAFAHGRVTVQIPGQAAEQADGLTVTANFFATLQVHPAIGRGFRAEEVEPGKQNVVILTDHFWRQFYGAAPDVVGRTLRLDRQPYTVIGVLPREFEGVAWGPVAFVRPLTMWPGAKDDRSNAWLDIIGRLKPDIPPTRAQAELSLLANHLANEYPKDCKDLQFRITNAYGANVPTSIRGLYFLLTGLGILVFLIACVNQAGLQLARMLGRQRDLAIRVALGASRRDLIMAITLETLLVSLFGSAGGLAVGLAAATAISRYFQAQADQIFAVPIDAHVLTFGVVAALISTVVISFAPAFVASRSSLGSALRASQATTSSKSQMRMRRGLVVAQLALAISVVVTASAFVIASRRLQARDLGWKPETLFSASITLPEEGYPNEQRISDFQRELVTRLQALPGAEHVAIGPLPIWMFGNPIPFSVEGQPAEPSEKQPVAMTVLVTNDFFGALHIPLKTGRAIEDTEGSAVGRKVVINEALADHFWPKGDALGKRIRFSDAGEWLEVAGVVGNVDPTGNLTAPSAFQVYRSLLAAPPRSFTVLIRSGVGKGALATAARNTVSELDKEIPLERAGMVEEFLSATNPFVVLNSILLALASVATALAMMGVYAMLAQFTVQRSREFAIRISMGAQPTDILFGVLRQALVLFLIASAIGAYGGFAIIKLLRGAMPVLSFPGLSFDLALLVALLLLTGAASFVPARRASKADPSTLLRSE